eukprot:COSAG06_NODE_21196_length_766_cov_1.133433_1_plen_58_part_00
MERSARAACHSYITHTSSCWCVLQEVADHVHELVQRSVYSWRTVHYDVFQKFTNGIL